MPSSARRPPAFVEPMTAALVRQLPEGGAWLYEVKLDGYRALVVKDGTKVHLRSRNNKDLTLTYPGVTAAAANLNAGSVVLDGEIVALDSNGLPSFQALQHRSAHGRHVVVFYAFDLLYLDGVDLRSLPLEQRRARLPEVLRGSRLLLSETIPGTADQVIDAVGRLGLEGVIAKRKDSRYDAAQRGHVWVKLKLERQQELVIGGYRPGPHGVDALLVGYYEGSDLKFAGKVRAGFTPHLRREIHRTLQSAHATRCPFADLPTSTAGRWGGGVPAEQMAEMQWVKPVHVAQIRFVEWTADHHLRHAAFLGLRTDKPARRVRRETADARSGIEDESPT